MIIRIWAFIIATLGVGIGFWCLKRNKWSIGSWIICLSLTIFVGGSLNIEKISFIENSFNALKENLKEAQKRIDGLDIKVTQVVALKQEVTQTVSVVTEVKKDVANLKEVMHQQYASFKKEIFKNNDLGKRTVVYQNPLNPETGLVIFFELTDIPEENSVQIVDAYGTIYPASVYKIDSNVIGLKVLGFKSDSILKGSDFYEIKYIPDTISNKEMFTINNLRIRKLDNEHFVVNYKLRVK